MTDDELASFLQIPVAQVARITPERRATYERMAGVVEADHNGTPMPPGVIVCTRKRKKWRKP